MELPMTMDLLLKILGTVAVMGLVDVLLRIYDALVLKPKRLRSKLVKQGIRGPPASFLLGNSREVKSVIPKSVKNQSQVGAQQGNTILHNYASSLFPCFEQWTRDYGPTFFFSLGNMQCLHMNALDVVKEMSICTSMDFGKPLYQQNMLGPLLGHGVLTANGANWVHQRKIVGREFTMDKIKGMTNLIVECATMVVNTWTALVEEGGMADIDVEKYLSGFSGDAISRACFGSSYSEGQEIFSKIRALEENMTKRIRFYGIPIMRYLPTKSNREIWRLVKEVRELILKVVKERKEAATQNDLLQMILEGAEKSDLSQDEMNNFIVDNCKNIYLAGYETTSLSGGWALMLLASNPEWQDKARAEVQEICGGQLPDADMLRKMKIVTMVINETLRLYPTSPILSREALQDLKFRDIHVPKGVIMWSSVAAMHQDPEIWGPDAYMFNPERFANGVKGSSKFPYAYQPFGIGPRVCLGQHFAMAELKILLSLLLANFSFSLSPRYKHSPINKLIIHPQYGVQVVIKKL